MLENDERYDTDLTEEAWALIAPILPAQRPRGRPRTTNLRDVVNAIFYLLRTGCQWRLLPREFPPGGPSTITSGPGATLVFGSKWAARCTSKRVLQPGVHRAQAW